MRREDRLVKMARVAAHTAFDALWKSGRMSRSDAYAWLAKEMDLPLHQCHISNFSAGTCARAVAICKAAGVEDARAVGFEAAP